VWVTKGIIQAQKDDPQVSGATKEKKGMRFKKQLPNWRFAPNHQSHWLWNHPYSLPMLIWNSSLGMYGYPLALYFDPLYGSLYYEGLPNHFAYR
jgi:hypothetical protein